MRRGIAILGVSCLLTAYCLLPTSTFAADKTAKLKDENKMLRQKNARLEQVINQLTSTLDKGTRSAKDEKGWIQGNLEPSGTATADSVLFGKTFYAGGSWAQDTGSMTNVGQQIITPTTTTQTITAGYHNGTGYAIGDTDLVAGNVKAGVGIFMVSGTFTGIGATDSGQVIITGQTICYAIGDDGWWVIEDSCGVGNTVGLPFDFDTTTYPTIKDSVVLDKNTGLMWARNGLGRGCNDGGMITGWANAVTWANELEFAGHTDWRLPNIRELHSIADYDRYGPAIDTTYFPNTQSGNYWSSTTYRANTGSAWGVEIGYGLVNLNGKTGSYYVRAVHGGE